MTASFKKYPWGFWLILLLAALLSWLMIGCKTTRTVTKETVKIDSFYTVKRDTTYFSKDSSGHTYNTETIREYHHYHDTVLNKFVPVIQKEIIREAGQIVFVGVDSGSAKYADSLAYYKQMATKSKEVERTGVVFPWWVGLIAGLVLIGYVYFKK